MVDQRLQNQIRIHVTVEVLSQAQESLETRQGIRTTHSRAPLGLQPAGVHSLNEVVEHLGVGVTLSPGR